MTSVRLRRASWLAQRAVHLTPIQRVMRGLTRRGVELSEASALDVFAGDGSFHTIEWAPRVRALELWERQPACHELLTSRFPSAVVRTVDSFEEVRRCDSVFDLVMVDDGKPPGSGPQEHFGLFPHLFRLIASPGIIVVNVVPRMRETLPENLELRRAFYATDGPEHVTLVAMANAYAALAAEAGFRMPWWFAVGWGIKRRVLPVGNRVFSLAMRVER